MIREWIVDAWNGVMNYERNPLRHIPDLQVRHMVMQILAFMWSGVFACLLYTSPSPRDATLSRMPSSA